MTPTTKQQIEPKRPITIFQADVTAIKTGHGYLQGWTVGSHNFATNKHFQVCGCFTNMPGGDQTAKDYAKFIALMLNLREETGLTGEQIRSMLLVAPKMQAAINAAFESGMVPVSSAKDGGASLFSTQVRAADALRDALAQAQHAAG